MAFSVTSQQDLTFLKMQHFQVYSSIFPSCFICLAETSLCSGHRHSEHFWLQYLREVLQEGVIQFDIWTMQPSLLASLSASICYMLLSLYMQAKVICVSVFQDYQRMLDLIRDIILATDLAHHLRIFKDLQRMADRKSQQLSMHRRIFTFALYSRP